MVHAVPPLDGFVICGVHPIKCTHVDPDLVRVSPLVVEHVDPANFAEMVSRRFGAPLVQGQCVCALYDFDPFFGCDHSRGCAAATERTCAAPRCVELVQQYDLKHNGPAVARRFHRLILGMREVL
jgi:hypothetical protein